MLQITISKRAALWIAVALLLTIPGVVAAQSIFEDVSDGNVHLEGIEYLREVGITQGCSVTEFCPDDPVSRAQIASFLYRLSGNDPQTPPNVNASHLDGRSASSYARDPVVSRIHYDTALDSGAAGAFYAKVADVGTFNVDRSNTDLFLFWNAHAVASGGFCEYQLRINDLKDNGEDGTTSSTDTGSAAIVENGSDQFGVVGHFRGVVAIGPATVSVWVRGDASNCVLNPNNRGQDIIVVETDRVVGAGAGLLSSEG